MKTVKTTFPENDKVRFVEINTSEKCNDVLIKKYEVTWNAIVFILVGIYYICPNCDFL